MERSQILDAILECLQADRQAVLQSAQAAHQAATHEESRAEDSHDTRGLEASYLAGAQAKRALELERQIVQVKQYSRAPVPIGRGVAMGSGVELEWNGRRSYYFIVGLGGGVSVSVGGQRVNVITPQGALGEALMGRKAGDSVDVESGPGGERTYAILSVF